MKDTLEKALRAAHARNDFAALTCLYEDAAETSDDLDEACFFLTHAYVFALDCGDERAKDLRKRLIKLGREE